MTNRGAGVLYAENRKAVGGALEDACVREGKGTAKPDRSMLQREADEPLDFIYGKGFLDDSSRAEEFGDIQEVLVAGGARHGDHFGIEEFLCQRERDLHAIPLRHENIGDHQIGGMFPIQSQSDLPIGCFTDCMAIVFQNAAQQGSDWFFVVNNQD